MKTVLVRGPVFSKSGYGEHTRQIFRYLLKKNIEITVQPLNWGITPWFVDPSSCNGLIGELQERCNFNPNKKYDITVQCQLPNEWDASLGSYNIGVTAGVETDSVNPSWTSLHVNKMDKVIVPSEFTKSGFTRFFDSSTQIDVVPESYYSEITNEDVKEIDLSEITTSFNFLTVGVITGNTPATDRKNVFYLIKWFTENFKNDDDVGLIIKTNRGKDTTIDRRATQNLLTKVLKEIRHTGTPKIYMLHGDMSREEMTALYNSKSVNGYISATRGEGFGLPLLEAAAAGVPVIATNWSAHTEFLNLGDWTKLEYELTEVDESKIDSEIFMKGALWAEVVESDFKDKIASFKKNYEKKKRDAESLKNRVREKYSEESINKRYEEVLSEILN